jgi:preprotein translocase subunit SecE
MEKIKSFFSEYTDELFYKVEWPTLEELQSSTIVVFVSCLVLAIVIFLMDFVFGTVLGQLYKLF